MLSFDEKILKFRDELKKSNHPIIFFDTDTDGTFSYFQLKKAFPKLKGYFFPKDEKIQNEIITNFVSNKNDLILFFDLGFIFEETLEKIKNKKILWADHHTYSEILPLISKYNIEYLNPLIYNPKDSRPSCFLAYKIANLEENLPLVAIGSIADFYLLDNLIEFEGKYLSLFNLIFPISEQKKTEIFNFLKQYNFTDQSVSTQRRAYILYLTYESKITDIKNIFDIFYKLSDIDTILKELRILEKYSLQELILQIDTAKGFLFEDYQNIKKKYKKIVQKTLSKKLDDYIYVEFKSKISFNRQLIEELSYRVKNFKLIVTAHIKENSDYISLSFRSLELDIPELLKSALKDLDGFGGGHKYSAGARIAKSDFEKFKRRIETLLNK